MNVSKRYCQRFPETTINTSSGNTTYEKVVTRYSHNSSCTTLIYIFQLFDMEIAYISNSKESRLHLWHVTFQFILCCYKKMTPHQMDECWKWKIFTKLVNCGFTCFSVKFFTGVLYQMWQNFNLKTQKWGDVCVYSKQDTDETDVE